MRQMSEKLPKNSQERMEEIRRWLRKILGDDREAKLEEWRKSNGDRLRKLINNFKNRRNLN